MAALGVVPASRVAMDTSSLLIAFGPPLTFKAPAPKLIISDEFKVVLIVNSFDISFPCINLLGFILTLLLGISCTYHVHFLH